MIKRFLFLVIVFVVFNRELYSQLESPVGKWILEQHTIINEESPFDTLAILTNIEDEPYLEFYDNGTFEQNISGVTYNGQ